MLRVNGQAYALSDQDPTQSLAAFLRGVGDKSCKVACGTGACGSCTVLCSAPGATGAPVTKSLLACLAQLGSLAGCAVTTATGLGNSRDGFHPIQERIGAFHASQCGYCTPGIVAACAAAAERLRRPQEQGPGEGEGLKIPKGGCSGGGSEEGALVEAEQALDGNLCRCTGYRPVLDVAKSLVPGVDIEDLGLHLTLAAGPAGAGCGLPAAATELPQPGAELRHGGNVWLAPTTLSELMDALQQHSQGGRTPQLVAGNTGAGLYPALWPGGEECSAIISLQRVKELREVSAGKDMLTVGAATTIAELAEVLCTLGGTAAGGPSAPFDTLAATLKRVAGTHVRNAASVGGNLVLARCHGLESDVATLLAGWGASVRLASATAGVSDVPVLDFIRPTVASKGSAGAAGGSGRHSPTNATNGLEPEVVVTHILLPLPREGDYYWCHKVAPAYSNSHAVMNAAFKLSLRPPSGRIHAAAATSTSGGGGVPAPTVAAATVVFGYPGASGWECHRESNTEKALLGCQLSMESVAAAVQAAASDLAPSEGMRDFCTGAGEGLVLQALAPLLLQQGPGGKGLPAAAARLLQVPALGPPPPVRGIQKFEPAPSALAPVGAPIEKDRVQLQASGEAVFTGDIEMPAGGLHAAYVTSTQACAKIESIDASAAFEMPGVVAFIGAADLAPDRNLVKHGFLAAPDEPIFAGERVEYYGQPLGLLVASSKEVARCAAQLVRVAYSDISQGVLTLAAAIKQGSFYPTTPLSGGAAATGDVAGAIAAAQQTILKGEVEVPTQLHLYMEPQVAMCVPDEGGTIRVHNSSQYLDGVQQAVASALGLRLHDVNVVCRRVGGGFGGKGMRNIPIAAACAVAAAKLGRPVRLELDRSTDMALIGGRLQTLARYDVGFTGDGAITGLDVKAWLLGGAYFDLAMDGMSVKQGLEMSYAIPNLRLDVKTCRANLPPATFMRAPGEFQATLIMESIIDAVAAACGLDPAAVRERNFSRLPPPDVPDQQVKSALGKPMPAAEYTLPQLWKRLKEGANYAERTREIQAFNAGSPWVKRGLSMTHCKFSSYIPSKPAAVSIYPDGSVLVYTGGTEIGQGLSTKAKQVAVMELSELLPEAARPLPLDLVRMGDGTTHVLPRGFATWGSTTSEAACAAVRKACRELVARLRPFADAIPEEQRTWDAVVGAATHAGGFMDPVKVSLVAAVGNDSSEGAPMAPAYTMFGAACSEAEVNLLTGERQVLRTDVLVDVGKSMNPAIDIGQAEGAFVQGLGLVLSEEAVRDPATGRLVNNSLWDYQLPTGSTIPRVFNVDLLLGSRFDRGVLSSKAVGEPPLLLSASAYLAIQAAVRAGRHEVHGEAASACTTTAGGVPQLVRESPKSVLAQGEEGPGSGNGAAGWVRLPASMRSVKEAVGPFDLAARLREAMGGPVAKSG